MNRFTRKLRIFFHNQRHDINKLYSLQLYDCSTRTTPPKTSVTPGKIWLGS